MAQYDLELWYCNYNYTDNVLRDVRQRLLTIDLLVVVYEYLIYIYIEIDWLHTWEIKRKHENFFNYYLLILDEDQNKMKAEDVFLVVEQVAKAHEQTKPYKVVVVMVAVVALQLLLFLVENKLFLIIPIDS